MPKNKGEAPSLLRRPVPSPWRRGPARPRRGGLGTPPRRPLLLTWEPPRPGARGRGGEGAEEPFRQPRRAHGSLRPVPPPRYHPFSGVSPSLAPVLRGPTTCRRPLGPGRPGRGGPGGVWLLGVALPAAPRGRPLRKRRVVRAPPCARWALPLLPFSLTPLINEKEEESERKGTAGFCHGAAGTESRSWSSAPS